MDDDIYEDWCISYDDVFGGCDGDCMNCRESRSCMSSPYYEE